MNNRDANLKQILNCDGLDTSVVYATIRSLGSALWAGTPGRQSKPLVNCAKWRDVRLWSGLGGLCG